MHRALAQLRPACRSVLLRAYANTWPQQREKVIEKMNKVNVRVVEEGEMMLISFKLAGKARNMNRPQQEPVEKPLTRIQMSLMPKPDKKSKKRSTKDELMAPPTSEVSAVLYKDASCTEAVNPSEPNISAWVNGAILAIGVERFQVENAASGECQWLWEVHDSAASSGGGAMWRAVSTEQVYTPVAADVGRLLRVTCTPVSADDMGEPVSIQTGAVEEAQAGAGEQRCRLTALPAAPPQLRVVTYNILADQYASMEYSQAVLFKHVPPALLDIDYRKQLVLKQLLAYNADIICLQEVDRKVFEGYLLPHLALQGFDGIFTCKVGQVHEGSSLFFKRTRFSLLARKDVDLPGVYTEPLAAIHSRFQPMLDASLDLQDALKRVTTIAQLALLRDTCTGACLAVANTHLFFHRDAPHIRTMHVAAIMAELDELITQNLHATGGQRAAALFCGDLNSDLNDGMPGALELLLRGRISADFWDWVWGADFSFGRDEDARNAEIENAGAATKPAYMTEQATEDKVDLPRNTRGISVTGLDVAIPFRFESSDGLKTPWTNYVPGYKGLLDYIWCENPRIRVRTSFPVPDAAELGSFLPNGANPSDHLAVIADIEVSTDTPGAVPEADGTRMASAACQGMSLDTNRNVGAVKMEGNGASAAPQDRVADKQDAAALLATTADRRTTNGNGASCSSPQPSAPDSSVHRAGGTNVYSATGESAVAAAQTLRQGGVIAVPTDTLYGLAGAADCWDAIKRIYHIKGRDFRTPLAISVASVEQVGVHGHCEHLPQGLIDALLPGPVTVLLTRRADAALADNLNPGVATIGVRVPDCGFMRDVCQHFGAAVVLTSANESGAPSTVRVEEFESLWGALDAVYDGGFIAGDRRGSTIVDLSSPEGFDVVRHGSAYDATVATLASFGLRART